MFLLRGYTNSQEKSQNVIASSKSESIFVSLEHLHAILYAQSKPTNPNTPIYPNNPTREKCIQD